MKELKEAMELEERLLSEMSRIGYLDTYEIYIRTDDPGNIPHMHIWDRNSKGSAFHTCIRLDAPKYFHHTGKEDVLNSREKKELVKFLKETKSNLGITNWKYLLIQWNDNNSSVHIDENSEMPDYTKL